MDTIKKSLAYTVALMLGAWIGFYIGTQYYPRIETKTVSVEKPILVQGEAKTETKTQIAYVPKETVVERYIDTQAGKEATRTKLESTDLDARIGKKEFNVKLNGKPIQFTKSDDETFMFDKNKIALNQTSTINFDARVSPQVINKTKRWGVGIGYGKNGAAGKLDFPVGSHDHFGGWLYIDKEMNTVGVELKF